MDTQCRVTLDLREHQAKKEIQPSESDERYFQYEVLDKLWDKQDFVQLTYMLSEAVSEFLNGVKLNSDLTPIIGTNIEFVHAVKNNDMTENNFYDIGRAYFYRCNKQLIDRLANERAIERIQERGCDDGE